MTFDTKFLMVMPRINANDDACLLVSFTKLPGERVRHGEVLAQIETTKAAVDLEAQAEGFLHALVTPGTMVPVGEPIAWILDPYDPGAIDAKPISPSAAPNRMISRKAEALMAANGVSSSEFAGDAPIREADVRELLAARNAAHAAPQDLIDRLEVTDNAVMLFGAADQGVVVADCLNAGHAYTPICFVDDAPRVAKLENLPVFDAVALDRLIARGIRLAHVCIGSALPKLRVAARLKAAGIAMIPAIHPRAIISPSANVGECVYVGPGAVIGPCSFIGNYALLNNNATAAHHTHIGEAVRISDGANVAGGVRIGDHSYLGLGVTVNTDCHIGANVTVVSGVSVFNAVPDGTTVRAPTMRR